MRNLKKFLALVLAMMMTLSLMVTVNASSFKDDEDITSAYGTSVNTLAALGVLKGYGEGDPNEGKFLPKNPISRAEAAAVLYRIVTGDVSDSNVKMYGGYTEFKDVKADDWFAPYVNFCYNNGLIQGRGNGYFAPRDNVTGYETLVMILRAIGYNDPKEFSNPDWRFKASGWGNRLGLTENVNSSSLGGAATREVVSEIMFKGMQADMVVYSPLTLYTPDLLVDASEVKAADGTATVYAADVARTLLYQGFNIVGIREDPVNNAQILSLDDYGRPRVEWVYDAAADTVQNGGKYIVNPVASKHIDAGAGVVKGDAEVDAGEVYIPVATSGATYATEDRTHTLVDLPYAAKFYDAKTECDVTKLVNGDKTIEVGTALTPKVIEFLNGGLVAHRDNDIDKLHTQEGLIGAPGRTTEIYKLGGGQFIFVYIDTLMGVVTNVTKATYDTNNHVMVQAALTIRVNDDVEIIAKRDKNYDETVGQLVLLQTYGMKNLDENDVEQNAIPQDQLRTLVPAALSDFLISDDGNVVGVDVLDDGPVSEDVTVKGTMGTKNHKTGIETDKGDKPGNVVFLASQFDNDNNGDALYYYGATNGAATGFDGEKTTVPSTSPYNYGYRMANAAINKSYTIYKDANGYVVGMTTAEASSDIGVVTGYEAKRIGVGKYAVEVNLYMVDGTEKTVLMLAGRNAANDDYVTDEEPARYEFYPNQAEADVFFPEGNLGIDINALVRIQSYVKDGGTYYKPVETYMGLWQNWDEDVGGQAHAVANEGTVVTGVADTLTDGAAYDANPVTWDKAGGGQLVDPAYNVDDDTKFIIAQLDWDYSLNEDNEGGYDDLELNHYTGFKTIPTVQGNEGDVVFQRIGNNVYVHPNMATLDTDPQSLVYTVKGQPTYAVADTYLVYATGTTYQNYSVYKALKDGKEVPLNVSNNNLNLVNAKIEAAMAKGTPALVVPISTNSRGYVTDVKVLDTAADDLPVDATHGHTQTIDADTDVEFHKHGVLHVTGDVVSHPTDAANNEGVEFLTVDKDVKVLIVNLETHSYVAGTQDSIMQYEDYQDANGGTDSHAFVYELNQYGYISCIYIID